MLEENFKRVLSNIGESARRSGRSPESVKLIAVTKYVGIEEVRRAAALGITDFGESRVQEGAGKVESMPGLTWHFIGHLQSNKVKNVLPVYSLVHSLDRLSLARALQSCAERFETMVQTLIQVNVTGEESKHGLAPAELADFLAELRSFERIRVRGLMTMAPYVDDPEEVRLYFRELRRLRENNAKGYSELKELSMGMTNDYIVAVEEGATMVRIGGALFD